MKTQTLSVCLHYRNVYTQIINYNFGVFIQRTELLSKWVGLRQFIWNRGVTFLISNAVAKTKA